MGLLGFQYRFERQKFDTFLICTGCAQPDTTITTVDEEVKDHLYGPHVGLKLSFKPMEDPNFGAHVKTNVGWLFKSADLRARENDRGERHAVNDSSSLGTVFTTVALDLIYSITKNWHVGLDYQFHWINKAAHIFNPQRLSIQAKIIDSPALTHRVGINLVYKFNP